MNTEFAMNILKDIEGTSPSYILEYGLSIVKEARNYMYILNKNRKNPNNSLFYIIYRIDNKISRINK